MPGASFTLYETKVKATTANMTVFFALFASHSQSSPSGSAGEAAQRFSVVVNLISILTGCKTDLFFEHAVEGGFGIEAGFQGQV